MAKVSSGKIIIGTVGNLPFCIGLLFRIGLFAGTSTGY
jgi:hypothetical protein